MSIEKFQPSYDVYMDRFERLKAIVPEAFADGKINLERLKECLGDFVEEEGNEIEHYAFTWPGKREARRLAGKPPQGTLVPAPGEGVNEDKTENIFIEGDNLEVLKLLQKSYAGKIKMIYIDPPYNTGNDFIYNDNFAQPLEEYLKLTGQIDGEGNPLVSNRKASGRFHSKWLNMLYPRLLLARNLLKDDGVIFISIDDNEVDNLKKICSEIFGDENFIASLVWEKKKKGAFLAGTITNVKEFIICYAKDSSLFSGLIGEIAREEETYPVIKTTNTRGIRIIKAGIHSKFKEKNHIVPKGTRISSGNMELIFQNDMVIENGILKNDLEVDSNWIYSQVLLDEYAEKGELYITQDLYFRRIVTEPREKRLKDLLPRVGTTGESGAEYVYNEDLFVDGWGTNEDGNAELHELLGIQNLFSFPKPSKLLSKLLASILESKCIVLDFFAGSGTLAHALLNLNIRAKKQHKYILVQIPEPFDITTEEQKKASEFCISLGLKPNVSELAKERIRRTVSKIKNEIKAEEISSFDLGFKVLKLQPSHFKEWKDYAGQDVKELMELFTKQEDTLVAGWKPENLLIEVMLQEGFPLNSKIEVIKEIDKNKVYKIISDFCEHPLFICFDKTVDQKTIDALPLSDKDIFICLDSALTDQQKVILSDKGVIKTI